MTNIGRFSLKTETKTNPSVPTFFIALSSPPSTTSSNDKSDNATGISRTHNRNESEVMTVPEFISTWHKRNMPSLHPRFHYKLSSTFDGHFEPIKHESKAGRLNSPVSIHVMETLPMNIYREDLKRRVESLVSTAMDVKNKLWSVQISSGELGSSGAISKQRAEEIIRDRGGHGINSSRPIKETVLLFKCHHSMGDAVSLMTAIADLTDEAQEIRDLIKAEIQKRKNKIKNMKWWKKLFKLVQKILWLLFGSLDVLVRHMYLVATTRQNPFLEVLQKNSSKDLACGKSISWCDVAPVEEVKMIAKKLGGKSVTVNDIFVSCVSAAIARQLAEHRSNNLKLKNGTIPKQMNVVIPVHLAGGIIPPGSGVGNLIGAFVTQVPCDMTSTSFASERLAQVHQSLDKSKRSPAPIVSYYLAKFISTWLPERLAVPIFYGSSANAAVAITNSRSLFQKKVHINGRRIEASGGFLPLPPNIPVGVVVSSYGSVISLSVNAETWAVPDADKFLSWILDEYKLLCVEASQN